MLEKAITISKGIDHAKTLFCSINIFFTAGSNNQAIDEVLPATSIDSIKDKTIEYQLLKDKFMELEKRIIELESRI